MPIQIPASASGELSIMVTDGRQLNTIEQRELRRSLQPQSVAQLMKVLNETRRNNRIYVRLLTGTPGAVVKGEAMTALPPSVLSVLESDRNGGSFSPIRSATVGEWEVPMDSAISGSRLLTIDVDEMRVRQVRQVRGFDRCGFSPCTSECSAFEAGRLPEGAATVSNLEPNPARFSSKPANP